MATIQPTIVALSPVTLMITWANLRAADLPGAAVELPDYSDSTVQIVGTFDTGTLTMQGSNDGTNWFSLTDAQGNAIAKTSAAGEVIEEAPRYIRPLLSGAGADVITVLLKSTKVPPSWTH